MISASTHRTRLPWRTTKHTRSARAQTAAGTREQPRGHTARRLCCYSRRSKNALASITDGGQKMLWPALLLHKSNSTFQLNLCSPISGATHLLNFGVDTIDVFHGGPRNKKPQDRIAHVAVAALSPASAAIGLSKPGRVSAAPRGGVWRISGARTEPEASQPACYRGPWATAPRRVKRDSTRRGILPRGR